MKILIIFDPHILVRLLSKNIVINIYMAVKLYLHWRQRQANYIEIKPLVTYRLMDLNLEQELEERKQYA